jgi:hypothetical protein
MELPGQGTVQLALVLSILHRVSLSMFGLRRNVVAPIGSGP